MNIHADDIGLSIVVPGSSYTLWLYATYCYCICGFYTVRAPNIIWQVLCKETTGNLNTKV